MRSVKIAAGAAFIIIVATGLGGCLNNYGASRSFSSSSGTDAVDQSNPFAGGAANSALITLSRVVKSSLTPTSTLDLFGDGSGAFGGYCTSSGSGTGNTGPSTCACTYSFTRSDGSTEGFDTDTVYREDDMIRCDYTGVPSDVTLMRVKIHLTNVDAYSNELTFRFSGGAGSVSPTDAASFLRVQRYQCKQALYIPHPFDDKVIDPFMSEDSAFAFMGNFYTTNMGLALAHFADPNRQSGQFSSTAHTEGGWVCPTSPNDSSFGVDLTLYSVAPDSGGNFKLYPPSDPSNDRSTFYLAKEATGAFTVPFHTIAVPVEATTSGTPTAGGPLGAIGYGASPIRGTVDGEESCPGSDVSIPSGYKWVKVWSFVGTVQDRARVTSSHFAGIDGIGCNPGLWNNQSSDGSTALEPVIPSCGSVNQQAGLTVGAACVASTSLTMPVADGTQIADRFIANIGGNNRSAQCAKIDPGGTTDANNLLGGNYTSLSLGADTWRRYFKYHEIPDTDDVDATFSTCQRFTITGAGGGATIWGTVDNTQTAPLDCLDPFNVFNLCPGSTLGSQNLTSDPGLARRPATPDASAEWLTPDWSAPWTQADSMTIMTGTRYSDIVYVVTPTNVMTSHFLEESETGIGATYRPFRFYSGADCSSSNPFSPGLRPDGTPDCPANRRIHYEFVNRDNSQADDPVGGSDPNQVRGYPICALQPL